MDSLDSIWDQPVEQHNDNDNPQTSSSQTQEPLFLAGSDGEEPPRPLLQNPPQIDVDIDAMFADVENDDDPFSFKPLSSQLDIEALRREAEAKHKKNMASLTPHPVESSSPTKDMGHNDEGSKPKTMGGEKGRGAEHEKPKLVRLDEGRLLGPTGFPTLIKETKNFRTKGKGHEVTDLNRLLQVYGYWTHEMYPKTTFRDTVERVEKLCHSKRMHVALSVWRDEAHGPANGRRLADGEDGIIDLTENLDMVSSTIKNGSPRTSSPVSDGAAYASSSSQPPSRPPSSGIELDDDDEFDIDAIIRDEEERVTKERAASQASGTSAKRTAQGKGDLIDDDEDMALWEALDTMQKSKSHAAQPTTTISKMDEDDTVWDELNALQESASTVSAHGKSSAHNLDEDEDMWDVVCEIESNATAATAARKPSTTTRAKPLEVPIATAISRQDDDDWDSVYA